MLNRKGSFLLLLYAIGLFIAFISLYAIAMDPDNRINAFRSDFGQFQSSIGESYFNAEIDLFSSDQLVKYEIYRVTNEFGESGGFAKDSLCEKKDGFIVWDFKDCNPDLEANYVELFKRNFEGEIKDLELNNSYLTGELDELKYEKEGETFEINYKIHNKIRQDVFLDVNFLNELKSRVQSCLERKQNLKDCVGVEFTEKDGYAFFTIENDKNGLMILEGEVIIKKPVFRFAVKND